MRTPVFLTPIFVLSLALLLPVVPGTASAEETLTGLARRDITPDGYPVRLSGFGGRREETSKVSDRIWAKALAIGGSPEDLAILVTVDNLGLPVEMVRKLGKTLEAKLGLRPERLAVTATHTHCAPMLRGVAPTLFGEPIPPSHQAHIDRYTDELAEALVEVATAACAARQRAELGWLKGRVGFAMNRRTAGGPVDHDLPVLSVRAPGGRLLGVYFSYACHCVTLSHNEISGDWAGHAQAHVERDFPGTIALASVGCGGDQNPDSGVTGGRVDVASAQGRQIADEVKRLLDLPAHPLPARIAVRSERLRLPLAPPRTRHEWEERAEQGGAVGYHARVNLERLDRGEELKTALDCPVQTWSFGDRLAMVFLPGEVVVDYSLRLKRELDRRRLWINAYANASPGYIPSERVLREGGYEGGGAMIYYDVPNRFAPGLEQVIVDEVHRQLGEGFRPAEDASRTGGQLPLSPRDSLATLRTHPELRVECVASEPLVVDPVAIDFGPDGRLWVVEMHDYPLGLDGGGQPGGRVKVLRDLDGDGTFDDSTNFIDGLPFPTGVKVWRDGALVCAAPRIVFARDTDGDGRSDDVTTLLDGFETHNFQARVNGLRWGLDGTVHAAAGLFGGDVRLPSGKTISLRNSNFRFDPDGELVEKTHGRSQQGYDRDDLGNWFGCENGSVLHHYPRHGTAWQSLASARDGGRLYPVSDELSLYALTGPAGRPTSACGVGIYRDELLGEDFTGDSFTCEPVNLLVHRLDVSPHGLGFRAQRPPEERDREFLASTDPWFRPVEARTGPDGALWIVDMYRHVIEHPRWIPPDTLAGLDVRAGSDRGRIYRILPRAREPRTWKDIVSLAGESLARRLASSNGIQRDLVHQLIAWREDRETVPVLRRLLRESDRRATRIQALAALASLGEGALEVKDLLVAARDSVSEIRRLAFDILPLTDGTDPAATTALIAALVSETEPRILSDAARAIARFGVRVSDAQLASFLARNGEHPNLAGAALEGVKPSRIPALLRGGTAAEPESLPLWAVVRLGEVAARHPEAISPSVGRSGDFDVDAAFWGAYLSTRHALGKTPREEELTALVPLISRASEVLEESSEEVETRRRAIDLLGRIPGRLEDDLETLASALDRRESRRIQVPALERILEIDRPGGWRVIRESWARLTPPMRELAIDGAISRPASARRLLESIDAGELPGAQINAARRGRLEAHRDPEIRALVERVLKAPTPAPQREKLIERYLAVAVSGDGSPERGEAVFEKSCAPCHRLGSIGHAIGPDLAALTDRRTRSLLVSILDPSRQVEGRYLPYVAVTRDGQARTGLVLRDAVEELTLVQSGGESVTIRRDELVDLSAAGGSFMPEGIEAEIPPESMADLLAYLQSREAPPKKLAGNEPAPVEPDDDGAIVLFASRAEIRGGAITFETPYQNIGYWQGLSDTAAWTALIERPGTYELSIRWACPDECAGNAFRIETGDQTIRSRSESTGGWDHYRVKTLGRLRFEPGPERIRMIPDGDSIRGALLDLHWLRLEPVETGD